MLKRLRGTPIVRHDVAWQMTYGKSAPYEVVSTSVLDAEAIARLRRFARFWDLVSNSGNFIESGPLLWKGLSPFEGFTPSPNGSMRGSNAAGASHSRNWRKGSLATWSKSAATILKRLPIRSGATTVAAAEPIARLSCEHSSSRSQDRAHRPSPPRSAARCGTSIQINCSAARRSALQSVSFFTNWLNGFSTSGRP